ncbi:MAG: CRISPR-associated helicase Cas3' [Proteobacteria bacterium]|nr:CRISPR-associated helicase Cas3' [Pseudomonadota bacterium]
MPTITCFWGKAAKSEVVHPVVCHMLDVGAVVRAFLDTCAPQSLLTLLAEPFGGQIEAARQALPVLAALHDVGKISPGFQSKRPDLVTPLAAFGLPFSVTDTTDHGEVAFAFLKKVGLASVCLDAPGARFRIAATLAAHHGAFPRSVAVGTGGPAWDYFRLLAVEQITRAMGAPIEFGEKLAAAPSNAWCMAFAGLVSVCDWIGSSDEHFPYAGTEPGDLGEYVDRAVSRARSALDLLGWTGWKAEGASRSFPALFPGFEPNDVQKKTLDGVARLSGPGIVIIEAPMGVGKTEAALAAAEEFIHRDRLGGMYYALPTMATSNQMFGRVRQHLEHRYSGLTVDLHLLHGLSDLNPEYRELRAAAIDGDEEATLRASSWFTSRKRGLLSPFCVGTIDQSLLAVLNVRHVFVRLFGLGQKVVVLDEVHAYDTYMSTLLDRLVEWLSALGVPVVVLSATLPDKRRSELVSAYSRRAVDRSTCAFYPRITAAARDGDSFVLLPEPGTPKELALVEVGASEADEKLASILGDGGCAVWICNTVGSAQETFRRLAARFAGTDTEIFLFHARFPTGERQRIEEAVLKRFGKGTDARPQRAVLVATQVVEQSLDLDFDVMVTELAPVDLLLQRAGRLHRHGGRVRPQAVAEPELLWIAPDDDGVPTFGKSEWVYARYVLLRSWIALRGRRTLSLPGDLPRLVEAVYGDDLPAVEEPLCAELSESRAALEGEIANQRQIAMNVDLRSPFHDDAPWEKSQMLLEEDAPELHAQLQARTRLSEPSVTIACVLRDSHVLRTPAGALVDPDVEPTLAEVRSLRLTAIALQNRKWVRLFLGVDPPVAWRRSPHLRDVRLAVFDGDRFFRAEGVRGALELSDELGLVIHGEDPEQGGP